MTKAKDALSQDLRATALDLKTSAEYLEDWKYDVEARILRATADLMYQISDQIFNELKEDK